jgi:hypothetical protein
MSQRPLNAALNGLMMHPKACGGRS